jgi:hypothetical protein
VPQYAALKSRSSTTKRTASPCPLLKSGPDRGGATIYGRVKVLDFELRASAPAGPKRRTFLTHGTRIYKSRSSTPLFCRSTNLPPPGTIFHFSNTTVHKYSWNEPPWWKSGHLWPRNRILILNCGLQPLWAIKSTSLNGDAHAAPKSHSSTVGSMQKKSKALRVSSGPFQNTTVQRRDLKSFANRK